MEYESYLPPENKGLIACLDQEGIGAGGIERAHVESPDTFIFYLKFYDQSITGL